MSILLAIVSVMADLLVQAIGESTGAPVSAKFIWGALNSAYSATLLATCYYELRVAREGADPDRIVDVFD